MLLLPGTAVPGVAALVGLVLVGKLGSTSTAGLVSLSRVTAVFGAAMLANGPAMAALRTYANGVDRSSSFKWAVLSRGLAAAPVVGIAGVAFTAVTADPLGKAIAVGAVLMLTESLATFEVDVLRAEQRFRRASAFAACRSVAIWTAAVVAASSDAPFEVVLAAYVAVDATFLAVSGWRPLARIDDTVRDELSGTWMAVIRINLAGYALNNGDQYVIAAMLGPSAVAIYAIGYSLGGGITSLMTAPIAGALGPRIMREWSAGDDGRLVARRTARIGAIVSLGLGVLAAVAIAAAGSLGLLRVLLDSPKLPVVASLIALAVAVHAASSIAYVPRLAAARQERSWSRATWTTGASAILLVPFMTAAFGLIGTAVATLIAYVELGVLLAVVFRRHASSLEFGGERT